MLKEIKMEKKNVENEIEKLRDELCILVEILQYNFLDTEVIKKSNKLDYLIGKFISKSRV